MKNNEDSIERSGFIISSVSQLCKSTEFQQQSAETGITISQKALGPCVFRRNT